MPNIRKGDPLWRSFDKQWEDLMSGKTAERRISAQFLIEETEQGFRLTFTAEDGTNRSEEFTQEHQLARTDQTASIKEVLGKLGDTPYLCKDVEIRFSQPWFIPRSTLAEWRRKVATPINRPPLTPPLRGENKKEDLALEGEAWRGFPLMTCRFCLRHAWGWCKKEKQSKDMPQDPLYLVLGDGRRFRLEFDCKKCEMLVQSS